MKREEYISDETVVKRANETVRIEIEKKKAMDIPVVIYDREKQIVYQENNDGTRIEVGKRLRKGRYSERIAKKPEVIAFCSYFIRCYYILMSDSMINVMRVKSRVESGGHDVP